jgi:hypothetical protein
MELHYVTVTSLLSSGCKPVSRLCARLSSYALFVVFQCSPVCCRALRQKCFPHHFLNLHPYIHSELFYNVSEKLAQCWNLTLTTLRSFGTKHDRRRDATPSSDWGRGLGAETSVQLLRLFIVRR